MIACFDHGIVLILFVLPKKKTTANQTKQQNQEMTHIYTKQIHTSYSLNWQSLHDTLCIDR